MHNNGEVQSVKVKLFLAFSIVSKCVCRKKRIQTHTHTHDESILSRSDPNLKP